MVLVRYNPWQEMDSIQRQLNQLFDEYLTKIPAAELTETKDTLYLKLEVPGMEAKDLDVRVMVDRVAISGERKSETRSKENGKTRSEFNYGKFSRVIPLRAKIQNTNVTAEYKNGILTLTLPKSEAEKNKVVKVNLLQEEAAE